LIPAYDFRPAINKLVSSEWKANWDNAVFNKLHDINPSLEVSPSLSLSNRHDQTVLLRCQIGHTKITHPYLLTNDNAPFCVACNKHFTIKNFLLECYDFSQARNRFYSVNSLKELFNTTHNTIHLKEMNLYSRIKLAHFHCHLQSLT
jgi:hypothetical protein